VSKLPVVTAREVIRVAEELPHIRRMVMEHATEWLEKWHEYFPDQAG
jgi:hypothetical protein